MIPRITPAALVPAALFTALVALAFAPQRASASIIIFDTSLDSAWTVSGGGAVAAPAFYLASPEVSITSNAEESGQFAAGGSLAQFTGAWNADYLFTLPANASDISLSFTNLLADDRVVLQLNGTDIGDYFLDGSFSNPPLTGPGEMRVLSQSSDQPYTFTGTTSGTITTGFILGETNDIRLAVDNTNTATLDASTGVFQNAADATDAGVLGIVSYTVPDPAGLISPFIAAAFALATHRHRRPTVLSL
jgi:hypothetical protein